MAAKKRAVNDDTATSTGMPNDAAPAKKPRAPKPQVVYGAPDENGVYQNFVSALALLSKDAKLAARIMDRRQAKYLTSLYYTLQANRMRCARQRDMLAKEGMPHEVIGFMASQVTNLEDQAKRVLDYYSGNHPLGQWMRKQVGIGPVISAGFIAYLDVTNKTTTVGKFWSFAGYNPTQVWKPGEKRPFSQALKVLCWKASTSFMKTYRNPRSVYGRVYLVRKIYETRKNAAGDYADQARAKLASFKRDTKAREYYEAGKLPPMHINNRALRYAVKFFMSHVFELAWELAYPGQPMTAPWIIGKDGHTHFVSYKDNDQLVAAVQRTFGVTDAELAAALAAKNAEAEEELADLGEAADDLPAPGMLVDDKLINL